MKFFTRELFNAQQGDPDLPEVNEAYKRWRIASEGYEKHINLIKSRLPQSMQDFCDTSLHDGEIKLVRRINDELRILIGGCGCWGPGGALELIFRGVKSVVGVDDIIDEWWLYEEVHLSDKAGFEYHVLLDESELIVVADEVELIQKETDHEAL